MYCPAAEPGGEAGRRGADSPGREPATAVRERPAQGEKGKPNLKAKTPKTPGADYSSERERHTPKAWSKGSKTAEIHIDREQILRVDRESLPADAEFKGYRIILPLMLAVGASTIVVEILNKESAYTLKLRRRGIDILVKTEQNIMAAINVSEAMARKFQTVPRTMSVAVLVDKLTQTRANGFPVVDEEAALSSPAAIHSFSRETVWWLWYGQKTLLSFRRHSATAPLRRVESEHCR